MLNRRVGKALLLLSALVSLAFALPTAMANSKARIVRLSDVDGNVEIDRARGLGYEKAIMNMPVIQGAKVATTDSGARAEIELEDGSAIRLTPDSEVAFPELGLRDSGHRVTTIELQKGTAYFNIGKHAGDFKVTVSGQQFEVHDNSEFRINATPERVEVAVYKGEVNVSGPGKETKVKKNETLAVDVSDPSQATVAKGVGPEPYDDWNQERDHYRDLYASTAYSGSGFSSAYSYGFADLNYYGNYFYAPGWGLMWQPFGVGAGWSPFMDGAWMWYPNAGYMWVSSYPWGWMPYRYGAWNFVPGFGWAWCPGRTQWNNWAPYTQVRTAPAGYVPPTPPAATTTGVPRTTFVGAGATTIYPAKLGRPGMLLANRDAVMGTRRGTVITPTGKVIRPVTLGRVVTPTTTITTQTDGGKTGTMTATPHGTVTTHASGESAGHASTGGEMHSSGGTSGGHTGGGMSGGAHSSTSSSGHGR